MADGIVVAGPVIINEDGKVLLDRDEKDSFWKFCGGKQKDKEPFTKTAKRRAKEELGIEIKIRSDRPFILPIKKEANEGTDEIILLHYIADIVGGEIKPVEGIVDWKWFSIEELEELEKRKELGENIFPALKHFHII